jgi:hypothetical protein
MPAGLVDLAANLDDFAARGIAADLDDFAAMVRP